MQLYLVRGDSRALVLAAEHHVLVLKPSPQSPQDPSVVVEFLSNEDFDLESAVLLHPRPVYGCLGVLRVADETFVAIVTSTTTLGSHARDFSGPGTEPVHRILAVDWFCLSSATYDAYAPSPLDATDSYNDAGAAIGTPEFEHPCAGIRKILSNSSFYYSSGQNAFDLSTRLEERIRRQQLAGDRHGGDGTTTDHIGDAEGEANVRASYNPLFLWNTFLITPLLNFRSSLPPPVRAVFDRQAFLVLAIQGYCGVYDLNLGGEPAVLSLISRLGWKRAGTRFNVRGVDDDGSVANFVETETILRTPSLCFAFTQIRGSVPLFWEETGVQPFGLKITITRPIESSLPAFLRHFESLFDSYTSVHIVNLLSTKDQEAALTEAYEAHIQAAALVEDEFREHCTFTLFDFHARSKLGGIESVKRQLATTLGDIAEAHGSSTISVDENGTPTLVLGQKGVFRTNCKDCLDRTNVVQDVLSRFAIEEFIRNTSPAWGTNDNALWGSHRILFAENGDALSKIYVGTGAINTSFTRSGKKSFAGILSDATKSVGRMYQSNFIDNGKQKAIDALLGHLSSSQRIQVFNPINDALRASLDVRAGEYTSFDTVTIWVGTYNLNGKGPSSESLLPWLFPTAVEPSLLVVAFQEIVPLTPQMIMATDPEKKRRWEAHLLNTLANRPDKKDDYILLRSGQLVGTALIVLVKKSLANEIRNVEAATKKTGLKGMAGNKGAVAIRLDFRDTSLCFLTAHLAAGHSNLDERNSDYFTIAEGLHFSRGRSIRDHENVIWAADTNYRISLPSEEVRQLAVDDDYAALAAGDQLLASMKSRGVFAGYLEGPLLFRPTYKYDNGTDTYDSSEKQRIPAWTDRILYRGNALDLNKYHRAELMASDHRPVYALFRVNVRKIDRTKRDDVRKQVLRDILAREPDEKLDEKLDRLLTGVGNLPPPSDEKQNWWGDENGTSVEPVTGSRNPDVSNPFDDDYILPPPVVSAATLASKAPTSVRRKPPPVPRPVPVPAAEEKLLSPPRPPPVPLRPGNGSIKRSTSTNSLLDDSDSDGMDQSTKTPGSWQVIEAK